MSGITKIEAIKDILLCLCFIAIFLLWGALRNCKTEIVYTPEYKGSERHDTLTPIKASPYQEFKKKRERISPKSISLPQTPTASTDSVFEYAEHYGDSVVKIQVNTEGLGRLLAQDVSWTVLPRPIKVPNNDKLKMYAGLQVGPGVISPTLALSRKKGLVTLSANILNKDIQVGYLWKISLKR